MAQIENSYMFFVKFWFIRHFGLHEFQQFRLHARIRSKPYSRLCGKMKVLRLHFMYFFY